MCAASPFVIQLAPDDYPVMGAYGVEGSSNLLRSTDDAYKSSEMAFTEKPFLRGVKDVAQALEAATGIEFVVSDSFTTNGSTANLITIAGLHLDGFGGRLAETRRDVESFNNQSTIVLDTSDKYLFDTSNNSLRRFNVLTHEILHAVGLEHSNEPNQIMNPVISQRFRGVQDLDIYRVLTVTGGAGGTPSAPKHLDVGKSRPFLIVDDYDLDFFSFTSTKTGIMRITVTPTGPNADSTHRSDLSISSVDGEKEVTETDSNPLGQLEARWFSVEAGKSYSFSVQAKGKGLQQYSLNVDYDQAALLGNLLQPTTTLDSSKVVDNSEDFSLRRVVEAATNRLGNQDTVQISLASGVYKLDDGQIHISSGQWLVISGNAADDTIIDAQSLSRIFYVHPGAHLTLRNLTLRNGNGEGTVWNEGELGGAIRADMSDLILENTVLTNNSASQGGAVFAYMGSLSISESRFIKNTATLGGGAIATNLADLHAIDSVFELNRARFGGGIYSLGNADFTNVTIAGNVAEDIGGGLYQEGQGSLTVKSSLFHHNESNYGGAIDLGRGHAQILDTGIRFNIAHSTGGGIRVANGGRLEVEASHVSSNTANSGGGIEISADASIELERSEIVGNVAQTNGGGLMAGGSVSISSSLFTENIAQNGQGGGLYLYGNGILSVMNSTFHRNSASSVGGMYIGTSGIVTVKFCTITENSNSDPSMPDGAGVSIQGDQGIVLVTNSILAINGNRGSQDVSGDFTSQGGNIFGVLENPTKKLAFPDKDRFGSRQNPLDPQLRPLSTNGGETRTRMLHVDSPARNFASVGMLVDQRGAIRKSTGTRIVGGPEGFPDSGAVEYGQDAVWSAIVRTPSISTRTGIEEIEISISFLGLNPVEATSFDNNDIQVRGPSSSNLSVRYVGFEVKDYGIDARYRISKESGTWQSDDGGYLDVFLNESEVLTGIFRLTGGHIGHLHVGFPGDFASGSIGTVVVQNQIVQGESIDVTASEIDFGSIISDSVLFELQNTSGKMVLSGSCNTFEACRDALAGTWSHAFSSSQLAPGDYRVLAFANSVQQPAITQVKVLPQVKLADASIREPSVGKASLEMVFDAKSSTQPRTFFITTIAGTATPWKDFGEFRRQNVILAAGETQLHFSIPILSDSIDEFEETFTVQVSDFNGRVLASAVATILDDPDTRFGRKIQSVSTTIDTTETTVEVETPTSPRSSPWWIWTFGVSMMRVDPTVSPDGDGFSFQVQNSVDSSQFVIHGSSEDTFVINQAVTTIAPGIKQSEDGQVTIVEFGGVLQSTASKFIYIAYGGSVFLNDAEDKIIFSEDNSVFRFRNGEPTVIAGENADIQASLSNVIRSPQLRIAVSEVSKKAFDSGSNSGGDLSNFLEVDAVFANPSDVDGDGTLSPLDALIIIDNRN